MQKIFCFFKRLMAKTIPHDMAAGRAGGTVIVKRSNVLSTRTPTGTWSRSWIGNVIAYAAMASNAMMPTNLNPSE